MVKSAWYDIEMRGRRLEAICKDMNEKYWQAMKEGKESLAFAYHDRLLKTENTMQSYVEAITGLNRFLKKHDKVKENSILN